MRESLVVDGRRHSEPSKSSLTASARTSEHNSRSHWPLPARDPPGSTCFCGMIIAYTGRAHHPPTRLAQATHLALFTCQCRRRCARKAAGHAPSNAATTLRAVRGLYWFTHKAPASWARRAALGDGSCNAAAEGGEPVDDHESRLDAQYGLNVAAAKAVEAEPSAILGAREQLGP